MANFLSKMNVFISTLSVFQSKNCQVERESLVFPVSEDQVSLVWVAKRAKRVCLACPANLELRVHPARLVSLEKRVIVAFLG